MQDRRAGTAHRHSVHGPAPWQAFLIAVVAAAVLLAVGMMFGKFVL